MRVSARPIRWPAQPVLGPDRFHQSANAQNAHHPFHVVGQDMQRHLGADVLERFMWKCIDPIQDFIVPKGCSTVWRRTRILSGFRSSRACTVSRTDSCSQREIRRSLPVVHCSSPCTPDRRSSNSGAVSCVLFIGIAIGQLLTGRTKLDFVRADGSKGELTAHTRLVLNRRRQPHI